MWGCLFAGVVAVPVCPPDPTRLPATLPHFNRIVADCGAAAILTDRSFHMVCGSWPHLPAQTNGSSSHAAADKFPLTLVGVLTCSC